MKKKLRYLAIAIFISAITLVLLAFEFEKSIQIKYWDDFNDFRSENGISLFVQSKDTTIENWDNMFLDNKFLKWKWILTNEEIATTSSFVYDSIGGKPFHSKTIFYGTHLLFWKNFYGGEMDIFVKQISPDTTLTLTIIYHSKDLDPGDFFYTNIDTLYSGKPDIFVCGTEAINQPPVGNISKSKADEILVEWKVN